MRTAANRVHAVFHEVPEPPGQEWLLPLEIVDLGIGDGEGHGVAARVDVRRLAQLDVAVPGERRDADAAERGAEAGLTATDDADPFAGAAHHGVPELHEGATLPVVPQHRRPGLSAVDLVDQCLLDDGMVELDGHVHPPILVCTGAVSGDEHHSKQQEDCPHVDPPARSRPA